MICGNCASLADIQRGISSTPISLPENTHLNGGRSGEGIKCLYPVSCTCQHKPISANYVAGDRDN